MSKSAGAECIIYANSLSRLSSLCLCLSLRSIIIFLTWQTILYRPLLRLRRASACHLCLPPHVVVGSVLAKPQAGEMEALSLPLPRWLGILHPPLPTGPTGKQVLRLALRC